VVLHPTKSTTWHIHQGMHCFPARRIRLDDILSLEHAKHAMAVVRLGAPGHGPKDVKFLRPSILGSVDLP